MLRDISHLLGEEFDIHLRKVLDIRSKNIIFRQVVSTNQYIIENLYDAYHGGLPKHILDLRKSKSIIAKCKYRWYENRLESYRKLIERFEKCNNKMDETQQKLQSEFHWYWDISNEYDIPDKILLLVAELKILNEDSLKIQLKISKLRDRLFYIH